MVDVVYTKTICVYVDAEDKDDAEVKAQELADTMLSDKMEFDYALVYD